MRIGHPTRPRKSSRFAHAGGALLAILTLALPAGCDSRGQTDAAAEAEKAKRFIAFVGAGPDDPLWPVLQRSAKTYARDFTRLRLECMNPPGSSPVDQVNFVRSLNDPDMRGLCINVISPDALTPLLDRMVSQGLVVVAMVRPLPPALSNGYAGFDEPLIGERLADAAATFMRRGTLMVLHAGKDDTAYGQRLSGFQSAVATRPALEVIGEVDCQADELQARQIIRERSERYPRLNGWVSLDNWPLHDPQLVSLLPPSCKFVAFSAAPVNPEIIRSGRAVVVVPDVRAIGAQALQFCEMALRNPSRFHPRYTAPLRLVTAENLEQYLGDWKSWSGTATTSQP